MTIKAGAWDTLWERMGNRRPCGPWRRYLATYSTVSEALAGIRECVVRGEKQGWGGPIFCEGLRDNDRAASRTWLRCLTGVADPTTEQVLDALRKYEDA